MGWIVVWETSFNYTITYIFGENVLKSSNLVVQPVYACMYSVELAEIHSNLIEWIKHVYMMLFHPCGLDCGMGNQFQLYNYIYFWVKCAKI